MPYKSIDQKRQKDKLRIKQKRRDHMVWDDKNVAPVSPDLNRKEIPQKTHHIKRSKEFAMMYDLNEFSNYLARQRDPFKDWILKQRQVCFDFKEKYGAKVWLQKIKEIMCEFKRRVEEPRIRYSMMECMTELHQYKTKQILTIEGNASRFSITLIQPSQKDVSTLVKIRRGVFL